MSERELSLGEFSAEMALVAMEFGAVMHEGLDIAAEMVEKTAKAEFGVYQDAIGPFPQWAELADSTKSERLRLGYSENEPLLRTGALRDSISHETKGLEAEIGSDSDIMVFHEFGTDKIPPRPVLGPAVHHNIEHILSILGRASVMGVMGRHRIKGRLGYDLNLSK